MGAGLVEPAPEQNLTKTKEKIVKKNNFKLLVAVVLAGLCLIASAPVARAQSFKSIPFLSGVGNLQVAVASTNTYGTTNIWLKYGYTWGVAYQTNGNGTVITYGSGLAIPTLDTTNTQAIQDAAMFANRDGSFPSVNFSTHLVGYGAAATNPLTYTLVGVPRSVGGAKSTSAQNQWVFTVTPNGTNDVVLVTNVPTTTFQGCAAIRLLTVAQPATANANTNVTVISAAINGFSF